MPELPPATARQPAAHEIAAALGVAAEKVHCHPMHSDRPGTFKGLTMKPDSEGMSCIDARDLAETICDALGVEYMQMHGRGSGLRECCTALQRHLDVAAQA